MKRQIIVSSLVTLLVVTFIATWAIGADNVVGNEVVNAANKTLSRSGLGTAASPYKLSLNLRNANTWTGAQTFQADTKFPGGIWNSSGNVGVGTTEPVAKLQVNAGTDANFLVRPHLDLGAGLTGVAIDSVNNAVDSVMPMRIRGNPLTLDGAVGIGMTNPPCRLSVGGHIWANDSEIGGYDAFVMYKPDSTDPISAFYFRKGNGPDLGSGDNPGVDRMVIDNPGNVWVAGNVSAEAFIDRTPYPKDLKTAYDAVLSMQRLPDGECGENNPGSQLDHSKLHEFIKASDGEHRDLSATVSAQNEVINDLIRQIEILKVRIQELESKL